MSHFLALAEFGRYRNESFMGTAGFQIACERGEPLADITIVFKDGIDATVATLRLNSVAEDFDLHAKPWYDDPRMRIGTATKAALERLFGWRIVRTLLPDQSGYLWATVVDPCRYPEGFENFIERMGLSQPGADDDGQWYDWPD